MLKFTLFNWQTTLTGAYLSLSKLRWGWVVWTLENILGFVYTDKNASFTYLLSSPLNATYVVNRPSLSITTAHIFPHSTHSEPLFQMLALSECCSLIYSYHVWGHKNAGIFIFFLGGILIFHMYISYLENNALYQVTYGLVPKLVFLCQLIGSSYCNTAGYIHHFFSDLFIFGKENENVFIIIRFLP